MKSEDIKDVEATVYDMRILHSDKDYYQLQTGELYRIAHPTWINWWQIWCGFWFIFWGLITVLSLHFGIYNIVMITVPFMGWQYLWGFSKYWRKLYLRNKVRFWYIDKEFADEIHMFYSFRQRISDWGVAHHRRYKEYKQSQKEKPKGPKPIPKQSGPGLFKRLFKRRIKNNPKGSDLPAPDYRGKRPDKDTNRGFDLPIPPVWDIDTPDTKHRRGNIEGDYV